MVLNAGIKGDQSQITIYIPTFNRADTLGRAIRSALAQQLFEPTIQILVLDEPTSSLDLNNEKIIKSKIALFKHYNKKTI